MSRYIDAEKINPMRCPRSIEEMRKWIDEQPTADVVEPVRCKDCIRKSYKDGFAECYFLGVVSPDDYCSHGKRAVK